MRKAGRAAVTPHDRMQQVVRDGDVERREAPHEFDAGRADAHFLEGLAQRRLFERLARIDASAG